jgi:amino acid transporter
MAEEVRDAARNVPMSLFWSYFGNSIMGVILLATFLFALDDIPAALASKTGFPFMYVFSQTLTPSGVNALTIIIMLLISAANINFGASTARQTFAFARDHGLPFSSWIAAVDSSKEIPINAILLTSGVAVVLVLVNMGSLTAFHAIVSLQVSSLMFTYMCSLTCILYRRIQHPESLPVVSWSMGRWGLPVNVLGLMYSLFSFFWSFWPSFTPIMLDDFNWSSVLFVAVFIACLIMYWFQGRYVYKGPVTHVRRRIGAM